MGWRMEDIVAEFPFQDVSGQEYVFQFLRIFPNMVDVRKQNTGAFHNQTCWLHLIEDGKIRLRTDDFISPEARQFIDRIIKLKVLM